MDYKHYEEIASRIRVDIVKAVHMAGSGHPGGSLSAADIVTALYFKEMNIDPENPDMDGRDKFILSKGHAGPVQYAALAERGYFPVEKLWTLRKLGSKLQGHPNRDKVPGIEMSTGSQSILQEISTLKDYSNEMETNMFEMDAGAKKINETGVALHELSSTMRSAISQIGNEIDQFKV